MFPPFPHLRFSVQLRLVDLGGNEDTKASGATGELMKQANFINMSLSALGTVLRKIAAPKGLSSDELRRDCRAGKLLELLQDSLGGAAKILLIVTASPAGSKVDASHRSLL